MFEIFRQADASSARRQGGMGIGLALVKQLAELHGGSVAAESQGLGMARVSQFGSAVQARSVGLASEQHRRDRSAKEESLFWW